MKKFLIILMMLLLPCMAIAQDTSDEYDAEHDTTISDGDVSDAFDAEKLPAIQVLRPAPGSANIGTVINFNHPHGAGQTTYYELTLPAGESDVSIEIESVDNELGLYNARKTTKLGKSSMLHRAKKAPKIPPKPWYGEVNMLTACPLGYLIASTSLNASWDTKGLIYAKLFYNWGKVTRIGTHWYKQYAIMYNYSSASTFTKYVETSANNSDFGDKWETTWVDHTIEATCDFKTNETQVLAYDTREGEGWWLLRTTINMYKEQR